MLPDTGEAVRTTLVPVRSKVNEPIVTGQEAKNPLNQVMGKGFGLDVEIPGIGGKLSFCLPFDKYLPKVSYNPIGYITVMFGASGLKDPADAALWKNKEAEAYDKAMKQYQHESSIAKQKQKLGTAKGYYKSVLSSKGQARMSLDFGYFMMLSGRAEKDDAGGTTWTVSGTVGGNLLFSVDYTQPMSIGPVPFYVNINFSASAGICLEGLYFSFAFDKDENFVGMEWWVVRGITIDIRLALTVTLGLGVKGICSVWVSATGALNIILTLTFGLPLHVAVYAEIIISVGFEIFWIKYSKAVSNIPKWKIWSNYNLDTPEKKAFALFTALADTPETDEATLTPLEPERYPQLAPEATRLFDQEANMGAHIEAVRFKDDDFVFYIQQTDSARDLRYRNLRTKKGSRTKDNIAYEFFDEARFYNLDGYSDYDYHVYHDGSSLHVLAMMAKSFDADGNPVPGGTVNDPNIVVYYVKYSGFSRYRNELVKEHAIIFPWIPTQLNGLSPICSVPHIDSVVVNEKNEMEVYGSVYGQSDDNTMSQYNLFYMLPAKEKSVFYGDLTAEAQGKQYRRVALHSNMRNCSRDLNEESWPPRTNDWGITRLPCLGFVALEKPLDGNGDSVLELFDYSMNLSDAYVRGSDGNFCPGLCRCPASGGRGNARPDRPNGPVGDRTQRVRTGGRRRGRCRGGLRRFRTCRVFPHYRGWRGAHRGPGTVRGRYGGPAAPRGCLGTGEAGRWDDPNAAVFRRHAPAPPGRRGAAVPAVRGLCGGGISPGRTV